MTSSFTNAPMRASIGGAPLCAILPAHYTKPTHGERETNPGHCPEIGEVDQPSPLFA